MRLQVQSEGLTACISSANSSRPQLFIRDHISPVVDISPERCEVIRKALGKRCLTTTELEAVLESEGARCPDGLARTLNVMRRKGLIHGKVSTERGGWVWWAGTDQEAEL